MNPILRVHLIIIEFFPFIQDPFGALWGTLDSFGNGFGRSFFALRRRAKFPDLLLGCLGSHGVSWVLRGLTSCAVVEPFYMFRVSVRVEISQWLGAQ